jgi:hypothetical protein
MAGFLRGIDVNGKEISLPRQYWNSLLDLRAFLGFDSAHVHCSNMTRPYIRHSLLNIRFECSNTGRRPLVAILSYSAI